jgi:spermidine synthase
MSVYAIFFGSGLASLTLQIVWFKQLQFVLGSSTLSVSVTVASFFLGLSFGSAVGGRAADVVSRPLRVYGFLELSLALVSTAVTEFLFRWATWVGWIAPFLGLTSPLRLPTIVLLSLMTLLLPTILMGATLPFLVRFLVHSKDQLARRVGILYGVNTLGAATGALLVGFVLIGMLGVAGSSSFGSLLYACIGCLALIAARRERPIPDRGRNRAPAGTIATPAIGANILLWSFAASGFVSIAYEVVWFRMLINASNSCVYAFSGMLGTYLLGLVLGSLICAIFLAHRKDRLLRYFALAQLLTASGATFSLAMLGQTRAFASWLSPLISALIPSGAQAILGGNASFFLICLLVLLVPTTLLGIGFPLASELTVQKMDVLGHRIGKLYALNTVGGVLGSLAAGFVLIPNLGSQWTIATLISANMVLFLVITVFHRGLRGDRTLWRQFAATSGVLLLAFLFFGPRYLEKELTTFTGAEVKEWRESRDATFVVLEYRDEAAGRYQQLLVNSKSYANNRPEGRRYMAAMAHYPVLLHRNPSQSAAVICVGTGTTLGAITDYDELRSISAVDLTKDVFDFATYFTPLNKRFYEDPRVHKIVADGRHFLLSTDDAFDVITLEPPPPLDAGVVNLYSEEFYALAKRRMRQGGVIAQWVPLDMERGVLSKMILKAMLRKFAHVSLWLPGRMEGVAIGSDVPLQIDFGKLTDRMSAPKVADDLTAIGLHSPEHFLSTFVAADSALAAYVDKAPTITDNRPRIEYHNLYPVRSITVNELKGLREPVTAYLVGRLPELEALKRDRLVVDAIWEEHEATMLGIRAAARSALDSALSLEPDNMYLHYLKRKQLALTADEQDLP